MFKHAIGKDGLKVIKASCSEGEISNDWRVVMVQDGEVNEIYKRNCFNKRDNLPTVKVFNFVAELRTLAKTATNFANCLRNSLIRDRIV